MRGVSGASGCTVHLGNARSTAQPVKSLLGFCCGRAHSTSPALDAVGGQVFQRKLGSRARVPAPADMWRLRTPLGGVSVPSLLRDPDSIWGPEPAGVRDSLGGPGGPAGLAEGYLLRDTWRHRTLPKRGASPGPPCRESRAQDHRGPAARPSGRS